MSRIGIVGAGIAGVHLGLFLQKHGVSATIYSDRSPEQMRAGRVPNLVVRFHQTRERDRALGVDFWETPDFGVFAVHMHVKGEPPIRWRGQLQQAASAVDMRMYQSRLLETFAARGGEVVVAPVDGEEVARLAARHELMVVAAGRGSLAALFPRVEECSPYAQPQRRLTGAFFHGISYPEPLGVSFNISPGNGEIFQVPFLSLTGRVSSVLFEGIPGQAFEPLMELRYESNPRRFEATVLALLREHAPAIYERVDPEAFRVTRPEDMLQGAITPVVRRGYVRLPGGGFAIAVGDMHVLNDPVLGQGANAASRCAWALGEAILEAERLDEGFCEATESRLWAAAQAATEWTNMMLQPPPPHVLDLLVAAAELPAVADELSNNFNHPDHNWDIFRSPHNTAAFLQRHGWRAPDPALAG